MSAASNLFDTIRAFKSSPDAGRSPQQSLVAYCRDVLGGIERVHFDFKSKANASYSTLDEPDKKNLAKAVSGFANGAGGVLIWGIEDESIAPVPIRDVSRFVDNILQQTHNVTSPTVPDIDGDFIPAEDDLTRGFAILLIPESQLPPHRVILNITGIQNHYFVRSGSSFCTATHSQLEDMFGRRPRPILAVDFELACALSEKQAWITVILENRGRGIARYPFLSLDVEKPYGLSELGIDGNGHFGLPLIARENGFRCSGTTFTLYGSMRFGSQEGFVIHSGMRHSITKILGIFDKDSPSRRETCAFVVASQQKAFRC
jgi:hypothetical protein